MSNSASAPTPLAQRARVPGRSGPPGRQIVGDYVGQPAAGAAQAVRRAGLRPGLERSFGCEADLTGLIVAQDPGAGGELARNGMVTLYVAAPGAAPVAENAEQPEEGGGGQGAPPALQAPSGRPQAGTQPPGPSGRRRRKPRVAADSSGHSFDVHPGPKAPAGATSASEQRTLRALPIAAELGGDPDTEVPQTLELQDEIRSVTEAPDLCEEEFDVHEDDVFAGRASDLPAWRRMYPRRGGGRTWRAVIAAASGHPVLAATTCAMLAVWITVAALAALASPPAHIAAANTTSPADGGTRSAAMAARRAPALSATPSHPAMRSPTPTHSRPRRNGAPRAERPKPPPAPASPVHASVAVAGSPPPSPPAAVRAEPPPAAEQTDGGPFSP
jgi:hypothetical protein